MRGGSRERRGGGGGLSVAALLGDNKVRPQVCLLLPALCCFSAVSLGLPGRSLPDVRGPHWGCLFASGHRLVYEARLAESIPCSNR